MKCNKCDFEAPINEWNRTEKTRALTDKERQAFLNSDALKTILQQNIDEETFFKKMLELDIPFEMKEAFINFTKTIGLPVAQLLTFTAGLILSYMPLHETIFLCPKCGAKA
jgi:hypothetical protein